jgi:hypothetical protein
MACGGAGRSGSPTFMAAAGIVFGAFLIGGASGFAGS